MHLCKNIIIYLRHTGLGHITVSKNNNFLWDFFLVTIESVKPFWCKSSKTFNKLDV